MTPAENGTPEVDPIDAAIEATAVKMAHIQVTLGTTGRPVAVEVPVDITAIELLDLIQWTAHPQGLIQQLASLRHPQSQLVTARAMPTGPIRES